MNYDEFTAALDALDVCDQSWFWTCVDCGAALAEIEVLRCPDCDRELGGE